MIKHWKVYVTIDRGEEQKHRFIRGACHWDGKTRDEAEKIASLERSKPYVSKVEIIPCTRWGDLL